MATSSRHSFQKWSAGFTQSDTILNENLDMLDVRVALAVRSRTENAPLGGDAAGDCYIVTGSASGAFSAFTENYIAWYDGSTWYEFAPVKGQTAYVNDTTSWVGWDGSAWSGIAGTTEFADSTFRIQDNGDATKELAFEVSGITTGTTRTITVPDTNVDLGQIATNTTNISSNTTNIAAPIHTLHVETVANQDYVLTYDAPYAGTITTLRAKTESGTCTVTGYINGVALGGTACSAATTADEEAHASANAYSKGDEIKITVTSNSSATDLEVTFYGTRSDL